MSEGWVSEAVRLSKAGRCQVCGRTFEGQGPVGRRDACEGCDADLHACRQCSFYDRSVSNQCREPDAERVGDKEAANFCDLFQLSRTEPEARTPDPAEAARQKLEALFKK